MQNPALGLLAGLLGESTIENALRMAAFLGHSTIGHVIRRPGHKVKRKRRTRLIASRRRMARASRRTNRKRGR